MHKNIIKFQLNYKHSLNQHIALKKNVLKYTVYVFYVENGYKNETKKLVRGKQVKKTLFEIDMAAKKNLTKKNKYYIKSSHKHNNILPHCIFSSRILTYTIFPCPCSLSLLLTCTRLRFYFQYQLSEDCNNQIHKLNLRKQRRKSQGVSFYVFLCSQEQKSFLFLLPRNTMQFTISSGREKKSFVIYFLFESRVTTFFVGLDGAKVRCRVYILLSCCTVFTAK